jgi:PAS domain S-box-containing protein
MEDIRKTLTTRRTRSQNTRPTIGLLIDKLEVSYLFTVWSGVVDAAQEHRANLICFVGGELVPPIRSGVRFGSPANVIYDLATEKILDGLIPMGSTANNIGFKGFKTFCEFYQSLPMVTTGMTLEGVPGVVVDDRKGIRDLIRHLVEVHGYRRIAFIRGPEGKANAEDRYQAYADTLAEYGLPFDPARVAPGNFTYASGREAIHLLVDQRDVDIEAIVAANDLTALGASEALQRRGIRVPNDVAVVGFDDIEEARATTPPLTTMQYPMHALGRRAVELLLAGLAGKEVSEKIILSTGLVVRQSCGCLDPAVVQAAAGSIVMSDESFGAALTARREKILAEMIYTVGIAGKTSEQVETLLKAFAAELEGASRGIFLATLEKILRQVAAAGGNIAAWQNALSVLRYQVLPCLGDKEALLRAEDLWQQARVVIGEVAQRVKEYQTLKVEQRAQKLREIEARLISAFDVAELLNVLAEGLPRLNIPSCYLSLYENQKLPMEWSRLILAYDERGRVDLEAEGRRFPSLHMVPEGMLPRDRPYCLVVEPLYFREDQIGFAVFEVGPRDRTTYTALQGDISSALQGALLVQRVQEHSAELARQKYILDTFMETVPDRIYFKDRDGRITRANKAHAVKVGLRDPAVEVGKTDFDFFPEEQARMKYEQEQAIIRTGQPVLAVEEPNGERNWALTTKMPLRDEHGQIIGTFGISRDITALKQAQVALEKAYTEVEKRVEERTAELQQEIAERKRAEEMVRKLNEELEQRVNERTKALQEANQALQESLNNLEIAQQQLVQSEKMASLGELVAGMAHEINTPLGVGVTAASHLEAQTETLEQRFLKSELKRSELQHYLETAKESSRIILRNLERASEHMKSFKRIAVDQTHEERFQFKLKPYIDDVLISLRPQLKKVRHRITVACPPDLEIDSYPGAFSQIISNLVMNSLVHGFEGIDKGEILIEITEQEGQLVFRYSDNGKGMDKDTVKKVFDPFFTTKRKQGGTGLGMYIVYNLVTQKLRGQISCESTPETGIVFLIRIPRETI